MHAVLTKYIVNLHCLLL